MKSDIDEDTDKVINEVIDDREIETKRNKKQHK